MFKWVFVLCSFVLPLHAAMVGHIQRFTTSNGIRVALIENHDLPIVDVRVAFHAGSAYDGKAYGLAYMTASLIGDGTPDLSASQIATQFDAIGASFSSTAGRDMAVVSLRSLSDPDTFKQAMSLFDKSIAKLSVTAHMFQRVHAAQSQLIRSAMERPMAVAYNTLYQALFAGTPYAHPVLGELNAVNKIDINHPQAFYRRFYVAKNAVMVFVGDITLQNAKAYAENFSEMLPAGQVAKPIIVHAKTPAKTTINVPFSTDQSAIVVAMLGVSKTDPDRYALNVAANALGGPTLSSMLYDTLREKNGLVYSVAASNHALAATGVFSVAASTLAAQSQQAVGLIDDVLDQVASNGLSNDQINDSKQYLEGRFVLDLSTNANVADALVAQESYGFPKDYLSSYTSKIKSLNNEDVTGVLKKIIHSEPKITVIVGKHE